MCKGYNRQISEIIQFTTSRDLDQCTMTGGNKCILLILQQDTFWKLQELTKSSE